MRAVSRNCWAANWALFASAQGTASCNTRFIKEHKPSNHIRARIKSHVYTTEWTVYHSTYHVKDIIKRIRMLFITLMTKKMSDTAEAKYKIRKKLSEVEQGATVTSTGRRTPRSPRSPGSAERTPSRRQELSSSRVHPKRKKSREGKCEYTTCTQHV